MTSIKHYIYELPWDKLEDKKIHKHAEKYTMVSWKLYKVGRVSHILRCLSEHKVALVLVEVHQGACGSHIGAQAMANKLFREIYYWPTLMNNNTTFVRKCDKCQKHANFHHVSYEILYSITTLSPFHQWSMDILGPFPKAPSQLKFLIVGVDYFT